MLREAGHVSTSYRKIKADVHRRLVRGEWGAGERLPTESDLAAAYDCARVTVNRALRELAEEGYLERRRKSGTRVRALPEQTARFEIPLIRDEVQALGLDYGYELLGRARRSAPSWLSDRMGLDAGAPMLHLRCLHRANGAPFLHEDRWISLSALPEAETADFLRTGPNEWLLATIPFSNAEIVFSAVPADAERSGPLSCAPGDALFEAERSTWFEGAPVTFVRMSYRPGYRMTARY